MSDVKWIKIVTDIFDDEKILLIESMPERDAIIVIWFKLLCFAGKQNNGGVFMLNDRIAYTDEMLSTIFRRPLNTIRLALNTFEQFGMIEIVNDTITIPNWEKHQSLDQWKSKKDYMREYMRKKRESERAISMQNDENDDTETNCKTNSKANSKTKISCAEEEREEEREEEKEKREKERKAAARFSQPTLEEVRAYCRERNNNVDAERFYDYYTSNGWKVGRNPMKDWKAAVRQWERHGWCGYGYGGQQTKMNPSSLPEDANDLRHIFGD